MSALFRPAVREYYVVSGRADKNHWRPDHYELYRESDKALRNVAIEGLKGSNDRAHHKLDVIWRPVRR